MKKTTLITLAILIATLQINAQVDTSASMNNYKVDAKSLFLKSKKQKTTAWVFLGSGVTLIMTGSIIAANAINKDPGGYFFSNTSTENTVNGGALLVVTGGIAALTSIPFFIASSKNKRRANLVLKNENAFFNPPIKLTKQFVAIGVKLEL